MTAPADLQGWPLKFVQHVADANDVSPSPAGPPDSCPLHLLQSLFRDRDAKYVLHTRAEGKPMLCIQIPKCT